MLIYLNFIVFVMNIIFIISLLLFMIGHKKVRNSCCLETYLNFTGYELNSLTNYQLFINITVS
jgi:hypothetical protein